MLRPMKDALSGFDVSAIVKELQSVVGSHVDKVYHPSLEHLVLSLRTPGEGKSFLHFIVGKWLYRSDVSREMPQTPSDFAMMLRKRITNAKITGVKQAGFDRIAVLTLEKEATYELILELFGEGNVILAKDGTIVQPLTSHTWKHRDIRARKPFAFPPPVPDPRAITPEQMLGVLHSSENDLVRTLATRLNLSGKYAEEICKRTGFDKGTSTKALDLGAVERILREINSIWNEVEKGGEGFIVAKDGKSLDVIPARLTIYFEMDHEEFPTFSSAVESYVDRLPPVVPEKTAETTREIDKTKRRIVQQEAAAMRLQDEARELQLTGDFVYSHYDNVSKILSHARAAPGPEDLKDIAGFESFDRKGKTLSVKVSGVPLKIDIEGTVESNAQQYYENSKKARRKLEGVLAALKDANATLEKQLKAGAAETTSKRAKHQPTKRFWFERFRWFISSEGAIVLGGKDAKSNDILVKKHLDAGDRYAHADVHGAPSVVVKMKDGISEATLGEAREFAVANSKAWNAKIGSAVGYWVLPEQVSKTPQSGEYLAKGAFVIRGKRNYSQKLEIQLGVGETAFEGSRKIMCGPVSAVRSWCKRFVVIRPGDQDKNVFARKLSDAFEVPIEEMQSILPPGDVAVTEQVGMTIS